METATHVAGQAAGQAAARAGADATAYRVLFIACFVTMTGVGIIAPMLAGYARDLGAGGLGVGLVFGAFALARAVFTPLAGVVSDRTGRKPFIVGGLAAYAALSVAYLYTRTVATLAGVRFLHGLASTLVTPLAFAYVGDMAPRGSEGRYLGTFSMSIFLGIAMGPLLGGVLAQHLGTSAAFVALAVVSAAVTVYVLTSLPHRRPDAVAVAALPSLRRVLAQRPVQGLMAFRATQSVTMAGVLAFFPLLADEQIPGMGLAGVGAFLSGFMFLSSFMQAPGGRLADRRSRLGLMVAGNILTAVGLAGLALAHSAWALVPCLLFMGVGKGLAVPAASAWGANLGRDLGMGAVMGLFNTALSAGIALGPLAAGAVMHVAGLAWVFPGLAVIVLVLTAGSAGLLRPESAGDKSSLRR